MRPKTRKAAVIKLETAYSTITARQLLGSNGTLRDPKVKTAASSNVRSIPPMARPQRCLLSNRLMIFESSKRVMKRVLGTECQECRVHRGHFSSAAPAYEQDASLLFVQTSLWHDSQRTEASQDFYQPSPCRTCPFGQVLAISERRAKFWLPSTARFAKVSAGCKPAGSTADVRPFRRNIS